MTLKENLQQIQALEDHWPPSGTMEEARVRLDNLTLKCETIQNHLGNDTNRDLERGPDWRHRAKVALTMTRAGIRFLKRWIQEKSMASSRSTPFAPGDNRPKWLGRTLAAALAVLRRLAEEGMDIGPDGRAVLAEIASHQVTAPVQEDLDVDRA